MATRIHHSRLSLKDKTKKELDDDAYDDDDDDDELGYGDDDKKKKTMIRKGSSGGGGGGGVAPPSCQAEKCTSDLIDAKRYYRRHKVCEHHSKAPTVIVAGLRQRFCQQCSRFHEVSEFDEAKRSCRRRLAGHNERRRKNASESHGEGSSGKGVDTLEENHCRQANHHGRIPITLSGNAKHFHIR